MKGKKAVVTGSTSGIGLGIARALAARGVDLLMNGLDNAQEAERVAAEFHVKVDFSGADLSKPENVRAMMRQAGDVDILVNNAGIQHVSPLESFPEERWDQVLAVNLSACFHAIQAVLPGMRAKNWGRIVNIASVHGLVASPFKGAYVASKHGLVGLTKVVALETARTGITCNAICPGWVLTPLVRKQIDDRARRDNVSPERAQELLLGEKQPSMEFATPEQIGELAVYLCADAAAQIRGASLTVDGGWSAQ